MFCHETPCATPVWGALPGFSPPGWPTGPSPARAAQGGAGGRAGCFVGHKASFRVVGLRRPRSRRAPFFARIARLRARLSRRRAFCAPDCARETADAPLLSAPAGVLRPQMPLSAQKRKRRLRKPPLSIPILSRFPLSQPLRRAGHEIFLIIRTKCLLFVPTEGREQLAAPTCGKSPAQNFHQCHGLRGAVGPAGKERRAAHRALTRVGARCGASGKCGIRSNGTGTKGMPTLSPRPASRGPVEPHAPTSRDWTPDRRWHGVRGDNRGCLAGVGSK